MALVVCAFCGSPLTSELATAASGMREGDEPVERGAWIVDRLPRTTDIWERGMPHGTWKTVVTDPAGCVVVHPDDRAPGALRDVPGRSHGCCGHAGCYGPNQSCASCGAVVATARTDCWTVREVRFLPHAVRVGGTTETR